jgi:hypothetical protein
MVIHFPKEIQPLKKKIKDNHKEIQTALQRKNAMILKINYLKKENI